MDHVGTRVCVVFRVYDTMSIPILYCILDTNMIMLTRKRILLSPLSLSPSSGKLLNVFES